MAPRGWVLPRAPVVCWMRGGGGSTTRIRAFEILRTSGTVACRLYQPRPRYSTEPRARPRAEPHPVSEPLPPPPSPRVNWGATLKRRVRSLSSAPLQDHPSRLRQLSTRSVGGTTRHQAGGQGHLHRADPPSPGVCPTARHAHGAASAR